MEKLAPSTEYNANMYLAESYCMIGQFSESMKHLDMAERFADNASDSVSKNLVKKVE